MSVTREDWRTLAADNREDSHALIANGIVNTREKWITLSMLMLAEAVRRGESRAVMEGTRLGLNTSLDTGGWRRVKKHEWREMIRKASSPAWQNALTTTPEDADG